MSARPTEHARRRAKRLFVGGVAAIVCALAVAAGIAGALGCTRPREDDRTSGASMLDAEGNARSVAPSAAGTIAFADALAATAISGQAVVAATTADTAHANADSPARLVEGAPSRPDADTLSQPDATRDMPSESKADPANKARPPLTSPDLDERAAHLVDAIAKDDPSLADDFFFPKAPFIPLKDVADPGRYFDQLLATYHRDIRSLRAERKDWTGATFVSFELGTPPTWVAPGKEYNKIGYFRTFGGKLRYRVGEKVKELVVSTIISWDGRWYVTHLLPIRH